MRSNSGWVVRQGHEDSEAAEGAPPLERVSCPRQVRELLDFLARECVPGSVMSADGPELLRLAEVDEQAIRVEGAGERALPAQASFLHLNTLYQVPIHAPDNAGRAALPAWITKVARRRTRRAEAPAGLVLRFRATSEATQDDAAVVDISRHGLAFRVHLLDAVFEIGDVLPPFELWHGTALLGCYRGTVRNLRLTPGEDASIVGLSITPRSPADELRLTELLDGLLYPSTLGRASDVWEVFESSGYLHLSNKTPPDFEPLRTPFLEVAQALEAAPQVGTIAHWPAEGPIQATVSHLKVYQSSWLLCQVSKRKANAQAGDGRRGLREMYLRIYESAEADVDTRWLLVYVQDEAPRWSRELHVELPRRYEQTGEACLLPFRALELDTTELTGRSPHLEPRVVVADPRTAQDAIRDLSRVRPAQYLDALDLSEARYDLREVVRRWQRAGLSRERQLLVAYHGDVRCALAVVETAQLGAHLYGLLDCLRMYPLRPGGEWAFGGLLRAAQRWFAARGRPSFVYLEEFPRTLPTRALGFRDLGGATFTALSVDRMPELLQRTSDLASQRPAARAESRVRAASGR